MLLVVHVTAYNQLMWDNGAWRRASSSTACWCRRICASTGSLARGVVVVNHLLQRGRRLGSTCSMQCDTTFRFDLVACSNDVGGLGEMRYRC